VDSTWNAWYITETQFHRSVDGVNKSYLRVEMKVVEILGPGKILRVDLATAYEGTVLA
jgi:hypothetical protein